MCFHLSLAAAWLKGSDCDRLLLFLPLTFSQIPKWLFFYSTRTDKGIEKLWLSVVTYVLCLEDNQAHSFSWVLQTHSSLESLTFALQWCPPFPRQDASQKAQAQGGPPRGVLEGLTRQHESWLYTFIPDCTSRDFRLVAGNWPWWDDLHSGHCGKKKKTSGLPPLGSPTTAHPPPCPRELDLKH